jgi:hypothetical protein
VCAGQSVDRGCQREDRVNLCLGDVALIELILRGILMLARSDHGCVIIHDRSVARAECMVNRSTSLAIAPACQGAYGELLRLTVDAPPESSRQVAVQTAETADQGAGHL